jgi:predicted nucleic acid-binding protein
LIILAHQLITAEWWERALPRLAPFVSRYVISEAGKGDPSVAAKRLKATESFPVLPTPLEAEELAARYIAEELVPKGEIYDALHLALASYHRIDYLVTWNCRHIAAASVRRRVAALNSKLGVGVPVLCTPEELMEP